MKLLTAGFMAAFLAYSSALAATGAYEKACTAYARGNFKAAAGHLASYVEKKPDPEAYYLLGYAHYKMRNFPESMRCFRDAYILDPSITPVFSCRKR